MMKKATQICLLFTIIFAQSSALAQLKGGVEHNVQSEDVGVTPQAQKATIIKAHDALRPVLPANARLYVQPQGLNGNAQQWQVGPRQYLGNVGAVSKGTIEGFGRLAITRSAPQRQSFVLPRLSAIGIILDPGSRRVTGIDPASDLFDRLKLGDIVKSYDGFDPVAYINKKRNYGTEGASISVGVYHSQLGNYETLYARRHPVSEFSPEFQQRLLRSEPPL